MSNVDHPKHYAPSTRGGVECIDLIEWMPFSVGNAVKYVWRAGKKGSEREDLEKALWYLRRALKQQRLPPVWPKQALYKAAMEQASGELREMLGCLNVPIRDHLVGLARAIGRLEALLAHPMKGPRQ